MYAKTKQAMKRRRRWEKAEHDAKMRSPPVTEPWKMPKLVGEMMAMCHFHLLGNSETLSVTIPERRKESGIWPHNPWFAMRYCGRREKIELTRGACLTWDISDNPSIRVSLTH
jgi:hypothetical protein